MHFELVVVVGWVISMFEKARVERDDVYSYWPWQRKVQLKFKMQYIVHIYICGFGPLLGWMERLYWDDNESMGMWSRFEIRIKSDMGKRHIKGNDRGGISSNSFRDMIVSEMHMSFSWLMLLADTYLFMVMVLWCYR